jgi:3-hydroxyacyl-CoA dehydrogenase
MGHGVAQIAAQAGFQVLAIETNQAALDLGMKRYENRHIFGVSECDESNFDQN